MCNSVTVTKRVWDDSLQQWRNLQIDTYVPEEIDKNNRAMELLGNFVDETAKAVALCMGTVAWFIVLFIIFG